MKVVETCYFNIIDKTKCVKKHVRDFVISSGILYEDDTFASDMYTLHTIDGHRKEWLWGCIKGEIPTTKIGNIYISHNPRHNPYLNSFDTIYIELDVKVEMVDKDIFKQPFVEFLKSCKYSDIIDLTINLPHKKC